MIAHDEEELKTRLLKSARPGRSNRKNRGPKKPGKAKNRDKTGHPPVEPVTRPTRCRVNWFLLFFPPLIMGTVSEKTTQFFNFLFY